MLTQTRIGVGSITFHRSLPMRGQRMSSFCPKSRNVYTLLFLGTASNLIVMIMLNI